MSEQYSRTGRTNLIEEYFRQLSRYREAINSGQDERAKKIRDGMNRFDEGLDIQLVPVGAGRESR